MSRNLSRWLAFLMLVSGGVLCGQSTLEKALVWPQFVVGGAFDAELRISNRSSTQSWSGSLELADQQANPLTGVSIEVIQDNSGGSTGAGALSEQSLTLSPRSSVLVKFASTSPMPLVGFLLLVQANSSASTLVSGTGARPAGDVGMGASFNQLVTDFAYNLKNESGAVIDRIPVPPVRGATSFYTTLGKGQGLDTGLAIVSLEPTDVEISLYRSGSSPISKVLPVFGQQAFFPSTLLEGVPDELGAALLEIRSRDRLIAVTSLDVVAPPLGTTVQIAGKNVEPGPMECRILASCLTFSDPLPGSAGFALFKILSDDVAIYWFEYDPSLGDRGGKIKRVAKEGGLIETLAEGLGGVNDLTLDDESLFWSEVDLQSGAGQIKKVPKGGGSIVRLAPGDQFDSEFDVFYPLALVLDDTFVYWGESVGGGAVRRVPKTGGTVTDIGRGQGFGPVSMVLDEDFLYGSTLDNRVARLSLQGGNLEELASDLQNPMSVHTDDRFVYWVERTDQGRIARVSKEGGTVQELVGNLNNVRNLALDQSFLYFSSSPSGEAPGQASIRKVVKEGGASTTAAECVGMTDLVAPIFVALDSTSFFVTDNVQPGQARILRLAR